MNHCLYSIILFILYIKYVTYGINVKKLKLIQEKDTKNLNYTLLYKLNNTFNNIIITNISYIKSNGLNRKLVDDNELIIKLNNHSMDKINYKELDLSLFNKYLIQIIESINKKKDSEKESIITMLNKNIIKVHINLFYNIMINMKVTSYKIKLLFYLKSIHKECIKLNSKEIFNSISQDHYFSYYKEILYCLHGADPNFIINNLNNVLYLLVQSSTIDQPTIYDFIEAKYPKQIKSKLKEFIYSNCKTNDNSYQKGMVEFMIRFHPKLIQKNSKKIYQIIMNITNDKYQNDILRALATDVPDSILSNIDIVLYIINQMEHTLLKENMLDLLIYNPSLKILETQDINLKETIIQSIKDIYINLKTPSAFIMIHLMKIDGNFLHFNSIEIFDRLSQLNDVSQYAIISYIANEKLEICKSNIEKIINILILMRQRSYQIKMLKLIIKIDSECLLSHTDKLYNMINQMTDIFHQTEILETLMTLAPKFILSSMENFLHFIEKMKVVYYQDELLQIFITSDTLKILESQENEIKKNVIDNIKRVYAKLDKPPVYLMILLMKLDGNFLNCSTVEIFRIMSHLSEKLQYELSFFISEKNPELIKSNIRKIVDMMVTMDDKRYQLKMLNLIIDVYTDGIYLFSNEIFGMITNAVFISSRIEIIEILAIKVSKFIVLNIEKLSRIIASFDDTKSQKYILKIIIKNIDIEENPSISIHLYDMIKQMKEISNRTKLLLKLKSKFPYFIIYNIDKILDDILKTNDEKYVNIMLNFLSIHAFPTNQGRLDLRKEEHILRYIFKTLMNMKKPLASMFSLLMKINEKLLYKDNKMIDGIKIILNRMNKRNYEEAITYIPKERLDILLQSEDNDHDCAICLEKIQLMNGFIQSNWCKNNHGNNGFHYRCINEALKTNKKCPLCKEIITSL